MDGTPITFTTIARNLKAVHSRHLLPIDCTALVPTVRRMNVERKKAGLPAYVDPRQDNREIVPHGFRSTFRDWAEEQTSFSSAVAEMALAHTVKNKVEAAYRRGDLFEKRRRLMHAWASYCSEQPKARANNVTSIRGRG
jgi:integrase